MSKITNLYKQLVPMLKSGLQTERSIGTPVGSQNRTGVYNFLDDILNTESYGAYNVLKPKDTFLNLEHLNNWTDNIDSLQGSGLDMLKKVLK